MTVIKRAGDAMESAEQQRTERSPAVYGPGKAPVVLTINSQDYHLDIETRRTLLEALRLDLGLTGTKPVCDQGNCGACTVLVDGISVYSCLKLAIACQGREVTTIEGIGRGGQLDAVQEAFVAHDAYQCGFCTPGQVMSVTALLKRNPNPSLVEIQRGVSGNLCRCGAYGHIFQAAAAAVQARSEGRRLQTDTPPSSSAGLQDFTLEPESINMDLDKE